MNAGHPWLRRVRAALCVAGIYGFFLIFAQFSFVELLRMAGVSKSGQTGILAAMALAGVTGGFFVAWRGATQRVAFWSAALAAACAAWVNQCHHPLWWWGIAIATGAALGGATVSLAVLLPGWCGVAWVGIGTGLGYAACNVPWVFAATPAEQSWIAVGFALLAMLAMPVKTRDPGGCCPGFFGVERPPVFGWWTVLAVFTALVWLDSAAFFVIQHQPDLRAGTWGGSMLWRNAAVHFAFACVAGWLLASGRARHVPLGAILPLGLAAVAVNHPSGRHLAGWLYPAGVSLYSAALVAWPGWFSGAANQRSVGWRAAWLFAVAGWFGSANGIGMAQSLSRVPGWFVAAAAAIVVAAFMRAKPHRRRSFWVVLGIVGISLLPRLAMPSAAKISGSAEIGGVLLSESARRGRETYISEGCLHCHSRYVRPGSPDVLVWGPTRSAADTLGEAPVLIGNRRQGPDLSNVGARRSATWLKLHFIDPAGLLPGSAMPSYESLFRDRRGEDLIAYLRESSAAVVPERMKTISEWRPDTTTPPTARGGELFSRHCSSCHGPNGAGNGPLARSFSRLPTNLVRGPFIWTFPGEELELRAARIIKFGIIGMDMPGHETLPDAEIRALAQVVLQLRQQPLTRAVPQRIIVPPINRQPRPRAIPPEPRGTQP